MTHAFRCVTSVTFRGWVFPLVRTNPQRVATSPAST